MSDNKFSITFNIYGGSNQILPNATKAEQHFCGDQFVKEALHKGALTEVPLTDDERRLLMYVESEDSLRNYVASLKACKTAGDVGRVVAVMCENEPLLNETRIVKQEFIEKLLPLIQGVEKGKGIDNLRIQIDNAWAERKRTLKNKSRQAESV